jgi:hypothetical protein
MLAGLAEVKAKLRGADGNQSGVHPADRAAQIILSFRGKGASIPVQR